MAKKLKVPVLADHILFAVIKGNNFIRSLGPFQGPGSIPPTKHWGRVNDYPESYELVDDPIISGTLKFSGVVSPRYSSAGMVMTNTVTGAAYFMLSDDYAHMMDQTVSDHNQITGSWRVIKQGHAFGLQWITPKAAPEPLRLD